MIRSAIRELADVFPLFAVVGSVTICASGLVSFDTSLALVRGERAIHRAASSSSQAPAKRKIGGRTFLVTPTTRRQVLRTASGAAAEASSSSRAPVEYERARCGDKLILLNEECDDGNAVSGDGCSSACKVESGFNCNKGQPSSCWYACGDGVIASGKEDCDDGNAYDGDGCSAYCHVEPGYSCSGTPSTCTQS